MALAKCASFDGDVKKAEEHYSNSILFAEHSTDTLLVATVYSDLGRLQKRNSQYSQALSSFNTARQYYYALNDSLGIASIAMNVGNVLKNLGNTDLAMQEYRKALDYFIAANDEDNQAGIYNNIGNIFKNNNQYDSAFFYMYKTLQIRLNGDSQTGLATIYHNLANLHLRVNNLDSALHYNSLAIAIHEKNHSAPSLALNFSTRGSIYVKLKDWPKAIESLERAYSFCDQSEYTENLLEIKGNLGYAYYQQGNHKSAAENFLHYYALNDSLKLRNENTYIQAELTHYMLTADSVKTRQIEVERDLESARRENLQLSNKIQFRNYLYTIIILGLIAAIIAILFLTARRRLKQTRAHESVLQEQNEELKRTLISKEEKEILLKEIHHRVKNNLQIINSLIRLQSNFMNARNFKEKLTETENRIRSMALIHEKLYKTGNLASLGVKNYIQELSFNILESYDNPKVNIRLKFDLEEREYGIDTLIPLGLIINEVLSNSIKHAFFERTEGNIFITLKSDQNKSYLTIKDDGIGADLSFEELKEDSLGMELIDSLCGQLDGILNLETENGFEYRFTFDRLK